MTQSQVTQAAHRPQVRVRMGRGVASSIAALAVLSLSLPSLAETSSYTGGGSAAAVEPSEQASRQECEQKDHAYVAFLACSRLLRAQDLDNAQKVRLTQRRAEASLVLFYFADAAEDFGIVLAAEPENLEARKGRAEALSENGNFKEAADDWAVLASKRADDIPARINLGKNLYAAGLYEQSAAAYKEAVALDGKNAVALIGLGQAFEMLGDREHSDESLAAALKLNPQNTAALMAKGEIAERRGDKKVAIESYMLSLKANGMQVKPRHALQRLGVETPP